MEKTTGLGPLPSKQRRRARSEWAKDVRSLRDSGLSAEEYAAKKGIAPRRLRFWMRTLRSEAEAKPRSAVPAFLPVSVVPAAATPLSRAAMMVEVDLTNGRRLRMHVRPETDLGQVSDLLRAIEGGQSC